MPRTDNQPNERPLSARDQAVVGLVGRFGQLRADHIRAVLFTDVASTTPADRCLKRLVDGNYLNRLQRPVGGFNGGSGPYIYQLGRAGWKLLERPGHFWAPRALNMHNLGIADCFMKLKQAEHRGELVLVEFTTEPDCHQAAGPVLLTPDAYLEVGNHAVGMKYTFWLELDRGTEHLPIIGEKCSRYWKALHHWSQEFFPTVLFVAPDARRAQQLLRTTQAGPSGSEGLFSVTTIEEFPCTLPFSSRHTSQENVPLSPDLG